MKKFFILGAALLTAASVMAQDAVFGNPKDAEGNYIVKYDLEKGAFAESNDWEIDETFVFAIDLTGSPLEEAVKGTSRNPAVLGRGIAYDLYTTSAPEGTEGKTNIDGRLMHIKDNIYGMAVNFFQQHTTRFADAGLMPNADYTAYGCCEPGAVTSWNANIFIFGWAADNPGMEWWDAVATPVQGVFPFATAPYTGTKTSDEFYYGDYTAEDACPFEGLDPGAYHSMCGTWGGYEQPAYLSSSAVKEVSNADAQVVRSVYYDLQGRRLNQAPVKGIYLQHNFKADGSKSTVKIAR